MKWIDRLIKESKKFFVLEKRFQHYLTFLANAQSVLKSIAIVLIIYVPIIWIIIQLFMFQSIHIALTVLLSLTILSSIKVYYKAYQYFIEKHIPKTKDLPLSYIFSVEMSILMIITTLIIIWIIALTGVII